MIICSIIVPLFNAEKYIENLFKTLELFIDNHNYEIILVNDFSSDHTKDLINSKLRIKNPFNIIFLKNDKNYGPSYSRNIGIKRAVGQFIAFLDSDDSWHLNKMDIQIKTMLQKQSSFCGTNHKILTSKNLDILFNIKSKIKTTQISFIKALFKAPFATPSVIIKRDLIKKFMFNEKITYGEDYDLWLRILRYQNALKINNELTLTFKHDYISSNKSLSANLSEMHKSNLNTFKNLFFDEKKLFLKFVILLAYFFAHIKFYRRKFIKFYLNKS